MSQRNKRLKKHLSELSLNYQQQAEAEQMYDMLSKAIQKLNNELDDLWDAHNDHMSYIYSQDDAEVSYDLLVLPDGQELDVMILETDNEVLVSYNGVVGKAKKHPQDKFSFKKGYNLACMRLMQKLFDY